MPTDTSVQSLALGTTNLIMACYKHVESGLTAPDIRSPGRNRLEHGGAGTTSRPSTGTLRHTRWSGATQQETGEG
ncbi:MAG: hypothetical protein QF573_00495 [Chloroflexota bacterium]|jgi:hypothetical protein|nr:hypothetical protein [Chloroflexota bacterium]